MPRPSVQLSTENRADELHAHLERTLPGLKALPGVAGITLNGGLSRGYADHLSEIDVTLYLDNSTFATWEQGHAPIATGIVVLDGQLYDVKYVSLTAEQSRQWKTMELWDLSYAQILHDPSGEIARLVADKLTSPPYPADAGGHLFGAWWNFRLAGDIWLHRGDVLQGHLVLNHAVEALLKALFVANGEYIPHEKWLVHLSRSLAWTPADWNNRLALALCVPNTTIAALRDRQAVIEGLWLEIDRFVVDGCCPDFTLHLMQKYFYDRLARLVDRGTVTVDEWQADSSLALLNTAPFHQVASRDGDTIRLDWDRLLALRPEDMYAWHYAIVDAVRLRGK